jgi:hypothetical protein
VRPFNNDHPHVRSPEGVMSCAEIRYWIAELFKTWPKKALARALSIDAPGLKSKLRRSWIMPGEQIRFSRVIDRILSGELICVKIGNRYEAVIAEKPVPLQGQTRLKFDLRSGRLQWQRPRIAPDPVLPAFHKGLGQFERWDP